MINFTVLPQDQIDRLEVVMRYILNTQGTTVAEVKKKFHLTNEEYEMAFDLCMPLIQAKNGNSYWMNRYKGLEQQLIYITNQKTDRISVKIQKLLMEHKFGLDHSLEKEKYEQMNDI